MSPFYQDFSIRKPEIRNRRFESGTQEIRKKEKNNPEFIF